jgi:uncharacterized protein (TIGR02118 family)
MVKLTVLYKKPPDIKFFDDYYSNTHVPLASKLPGLRKYEVSKVAGTPMGESSYHLIADLYFDSADALKAALSSPEGRASGKDVANFAKEPPEMLIAEVEEKV